jgi:hypothetical protein
MGAMEAMEAMESSEVLKNLEAMGAMEAMESLEASKDTEVLAGLDIKSLGASKNSDNQIFVECFAIKLNFNKTKYD